MVCIDDFERPEEFVAPMTETYVSSLRKTVEETIMPKRRKVDEDWKDHEIIEPIMKEILVDNGIQMAIFPSEMGGLGFNKLKYRPASFFVAILEEMARGDAGIATASGVGLWPFTMIGIEPNVREDLLKEFAPIFCDTDEPRYVASLMTEPQGGSDIENIDRVKGKSIRTTAELDGDEWVINGHKLWPTNTGGLADLVGIAATTERGSDDPEDFAYIFAPANVDGLKQGEPYHKAGFAADKNSDVWLEDVRVPKEYRAWGPGEDAKIFKKKIAWGCLGSSAVCIGVLINVCEVLDEHFSERTYRGRPMKENDAIASVLADIAADAQILRWSTYEYGHMLDNPDRYGHPWESLVMGKGRALKLVATNMAVRDVGKAVDIMGRHGAERDWDIEKFWRDVKMIQLWMGGKQLNQMDVAREFF